MNRPIQVGDLVVIVKPPAGCRCVENLGVIFQVTAIRQGTNWRVCRNCESGSLGTGLVAEGFGRALGLKRLKRTPPLSELESEKRYEEIAA